MFVLYFCIFFLIHIFIYLLYTHRNRFFLTYFEIKATIKIWVPTLTMNAVNAVKVKFLPEVQ